MIQAEWLPVFADPHAAFICGSGCIVPVGGTQVLRVKSSWGRYCDSDSISVDPDSLAREGLSGKLSKNRHCTN